MREDNRPGTAQIVAWGIGIAVPLLGLTIAASLGHIWIFIVSLLAIPGAYYGLSAQRKRQGPRPG